MKARRKSKLLPSKIQINSQAPTKPKSLSTPKPVAVVVVELHEAENVPERVVGHVKQPLAETDGIGAAAHKLRPGDAVVEELACAHTAEHCHGWVAVVETA